MHDWPGPKKRSSSPCPGLTYCSYLRPTGHNHTRVSPENNHSTSIDGRYRGKFRSMDRWRTRTHARYGVPVLEIVGELAPKWGFAALASHHRPSGPPPQVHGKRRPPWARSWIDQRPVLSPPEMTGSVVRTRSGAALPWGRLKASERQLWTPPAGVRLLRLNGG
jgi:hypothetical protein